MTASAPDRAVLVARDGHIAMVTLNRGANRNSMTPELLDGFAAAVTEVRRMSDVRAVVVTGTGACFSAGADFKSNIQREEGGAARLPSEKSFAMYEPFLSLLDIEVPVIGALNGHAVGGGFGLALACDLRIGAQGAKYGANFVKLGIHPGMAITYFLPRLIGVAMANELLLTGRLIDGETAARCGILNRAVATEAVLPTAMALAAEIAAAAPMAVRTTKRSIYQHLGASPSAARDAAYREAAVQAATLATEDSQEGIKALLEKRDPAFQGR